MRRWRKWLWRWRRRIIFGAFAFDVCWHLWWRAIVREELGMVAPAALPLPRMVNTPWGKDLL